MHIIHTSDWHLGQYFFTKTRAAEHKSFLQWIIQQIIQHQVDALIIAGDIFDTGSPPSYARELYNKFIVDLQPTGCQLIVLGGNHDSVATLNESKALLSYLNTTVIANAESDAPEQQIKVLNNRDGSAGAILCAIPYLRPRDIMTSQAGQSGMQKQQALQDAITKHYQQLYQQASELREQFDPPCQSLPPDTSPRWEHLPRILSVIYTLVHLMPFLHRLSPLLITSHSGIFTGRKLSVNQNTYATVVRPFL
ncbi:ATP-dependent dsDNA exonuclease [Xenorhabdus szentirmaii]|nr:ATP-dependent dsDNA exonuclease [Xenorhabdus szentirmaii]